MSDNKETDRQEARDPAKGGFCAEKMAEMMRRCADMMPDLMSAGGRPQEAKAETKASAGCCHGSGDPSAPAAAER